MKIVFLDGYTINPGDLTWEPLEALGELTVYDRMEPAEVVERAAEAEVLIVNKTCLTAEQFAVLPRLKLICVAATGFDRVDGAAARQRGITVCNCAGYSTFAVAQMAISLLLEAADSVGHYTHQNQKGEWSRCPDFCYTTKPRLELWGKRLAIVGFGHIGGALADVARALGMEIFAVSRKAQEELPADVRKLTIEEAVATCEVVSLNCPLTERNRQMVNAALLAKARPDLILLNTARGALVNETDVATALHEGRLGAYCTDVLTQEPPSPDCPLLDAPRCYITPHIGWDTPEARQRILALLVSHIRAYYAGKPESVVNDGF